MKLSAGRNVSKSGPPRAVLDTSILTRFLLSPDGFTIRLYKAMITRRYIAVTSSAILEELAIVMKKPRTKKYLKASEEDVATFIEQYRKAAYFVPGHYEVFVVKTDPKDNPIVACALEGHADYIVSDDKEDLLPIKHYRGIQIVSAPDFLRELARS